MDAQYIYDNEFHVYAKSTEGQREFIMLFTRTIITMDGTELDIFGHPSHV